jgi:aspartyl-tRNA(Asn)/glutamyl-tRNA(Gln) amidotransferase subunit C
MALITKDEVRKIAHLSRIGLSEVEVDDLTTQLEAVLAYAARVNDVVSIQQGPISHNVNIFREDEAKPCDADRIKAEAPDVEADYFVVPAIIEHE